MKRKQQRLIFVAVSMVFLIAAVLLTMRAFKENLVFFYSPSDLAQAEIVPDQLIRIGGLVEGDTLSRDAGERVRFNITDGAAAVTVTYQGMLPGLFREGQGAIAEGYLKEPGHFEATRILTKHDENYMPREVVDALKRSGKWQGVP